MHTTSQRLKEFTGERGTIEKERTKIENIRCMYMHEQYRIFMQNHRRDWHEEMDIWHDEHRYHYHITITFNIVLKILHAVSNVQ